jgi:hypothetical protein
LNDANKQQKEEKKNHAFVADKSEQSTCSGSTVRRHGNILQNPFRQEHGRYVPEKEYAEMQHCRLLMREGETPPTSLETAM